MERQQTPFKKQIFYTKWFFMDTPRTNMKKWQWNLLKPDSSTPKRTVQTHLRAASSRRTRWAPRTAALSSSHMACSIAEVRAIFHGFFPATKKHPHFHVELSYKSSWVVEPTQSKHMLVKLDHFPKYGWKYKYNLKPPPKNSSVSY